MASVFDVAACILQQQGAMTTWKLQKLVYYSQGWSLVWDDDALFPEEIEAWANGPVVRELYDAHRCMYRMSCLRKGNPDALTRDRGLRTELLWRQVTAVAERSHPHGRALAIGSPGGSRRRARRYHHSEAGSGRILRQPVTAVVRRPGKRPGARAFPTAGKEPRTSPGRAPPSHDRETIVGIRDRRALKLLWYDPHHGMNARAGYPVQHRS